MIFGDGIAKTKLVEQLTLVTLQTPRSWIDLAENRVNTTESRFAIRLNRLLQQNLPKAEVAGQQAYSIPTISESTDGLARRRPAANMVARAAATGPTR